MTPDGPPVIGATRYSNLHLNTGHGTLGWTMACGSARVLADQLSRRKPHIDASELTIHRYDHRLWGNFLTSPPLPGRGAIRSKFGEGGHGYRSFSTCAACHP